MSEHALLSPSGSPTWMNCAGSVLANSTVPSRTSKYAEEGTCGHELATWALESEHKNCEAFLGKIDPKTGLEITEDMCSYVQDYVDDVVRFAEGGKLHVEIRVDFSKVVNVPESFGRADAIILSDDGSMLEIHDLKYGMGVGVEARDNKQLMIYALGALEMFDEFGTVDNITLGVHMVRRDGYNSHVLSRAELEEFGEEVKEAAAKAMALYEQGPTALIEENLTPGTAQCQWCNYKAFCPTLGNEMVKLSTDYKSNLSAVGDDEFSAIVEDATEAIKCRVDIEIVAKIMAYESLFEMWMKAVRSRVTEELEAGNAVPGFKLVQGKKGNRAWTCKDAATKMLKSMRCKMPEMFTMKVISPTAAEKLLKKKSPKRWERLKELITRKDGAISVAPESDKRQAFVLPVAADDEFGEVDKVEEFI